MRDFNKGRSSNRRDNNRERPEMHKVICDRCGKNCEVPFQPSSDKPVFCDDCFREKNKSNSNRSDSRNFVKQNSREREYFKAVCAECGKNCEVPFKPTGDKPIYCSMCFDKIGGTNKEVRNSLNNNSGIDKQLKEISYKLDKILESLSSVLVKKEDSQKKLVKIKSADVKKTVAKKKAVEVKKKLKVVAKKKASKK